LGLRTPIILPLKSRPVPISPYGRNRRARSQSLRLISPSLGASLLSAPSVWARLFRQGALDTLSARGHGAGVVRGEERRALRLCGQVWRQPDGHAERESSARGAGKAQQRCGRARVRAPCAWRPCATWRLTCGPSRSFLDPAFGHWPAQLVCGLDAHHHAGLLLVARRFWPVAGVWSPRATALDEPCTSSSILLQHADALARAESATRRTRRKKICPRLTIFA
jgi:hypothetical protein